MDKCDLPEAKRVSAAESRWLVDGRLFEGPSALRPRRPVAAVSLPIADGLEQLKAEHVVDCTASARLLHDVPSSTRVAAYDPRRRPSIRRIATLTTIQGAMRCAALPPPSSPAQR